MTKAINSKNSIITRRTCWGVHLHQKVAKNKFLYLLPFSSVTWLFSRLVGDGRSLAGSHRLQIETSRVRVLGFEDQNRDIVVRASVSLLFLCVDFFLLFQVSSRPIRAGIRRSKKTPKTLTLVCCCSCLVWPFYAPSFISTHVHKHLEASHFELSHGSGCGSSCRPQKSYAQTLQVQRSGLNLVLKYVRSFKFKGITGDPYQAGNNSASFFAALAAWILFSAGSGTTRHPRQLELRRPLFFLSYQRQCQKFVLIWCLT